MLGRRHAGRVSGGMIGAPLGDIYQFHLNCLFRAGIHARWRTSFIQAVGAEVTFSNHAAFSVVLRYAVRAVPGAVAASDTGIGRVQNQAGESVFGVRGDRTALEAGRLQAVITCHGEVQALGVGIRSAFDLTYLAPVDFEWISVLFRTGDLAAAAADALRHVEVEPVLLTWGWRPGGDVARRSSRRDPA